MGISGHSSATLMTLDAEIRVPAATTQLAHFHMHEPADNIRLPRDSYWLDLCLTPRPRNVRACYRDRWNQNRFERVGNLLVLPPRETVRMRSDGGPSQASVVCHLKPEALREWFGIDLQWTERRLETTLDVRSTHIRNLLLRVADELRYPGFASKALVELVVAQLAVELGRYCNATDECTSNGALAAWRLRLIDERLDQTGPAPSLSELAKLCGLSIRQLTRGFRNSRNRSIGEHIADSRIRHAKSLLAQDQSVKAIAYSLGFSSPSGFCYAFRRATGRTPRQFRQRRL